MKTSTLLDSICLSFYEYPSISFPCNNYFETQNHYSAQIEIILAGVALLSVRLALSCPAIILAQSALEDTVYHLCDQSEDLIHIFSEDVYFSGELKWCTWCPTK